MFVLVLGLGLGFGLGLGLDHVERGLGHVGVRVVGRLVAVELALHRAHVDHEARLRGRGLEQPGQGQGLGWGQG